MLVEDIYEFRKSWGYIYTGLVLDSLKSLSQDLFNDHGIFLDVFVIFPQIEEQGDEWRLAIGRHQGIDLVLDSLYA